MVGANSNYAIERFYLKYFNEIPEINAELFEAQNIFLKYYNQSVFHKALFRLGFHKIYTLINIQLQNKILDFQPKVLLVFKGMELLPKTIKWAKDYGIKVVNYNPDNPFIFSGKGSGNKNVTNSISLYDLHYTYNLEVKKELEEKYQIPTYWLPFGFDLSHHVYENALTFNEIKKTCFVGNPDKARANFIKKLANYGIKIDLFGINWDKFINHKNVSIYQSVYGDEFWFTIRKYRVQLNPLRIHNTASHGMRSFEIPAIGGIMLAPYTWEHQQFFKDCKEVFFYESLSEAARKINYLLSLREEEVLIIRKSAIERCKLSGYSYKDRANYLIETLNKLGI